MPQSDLIAKIDGIEKFQQERTRGGSGKKPEWPSQEKCAAFKNEVKEILTVMGAKGAYISDVSMFGDFEGLWGVTEQTSKDDADRITTEKCKEFSEKLGLGLDGIKPTDYIVEVAQKLAKGKKTKSIAEPSIQLTIQSHNQPIQITPGRTCGNGGCGCR